MAQKGRNYSFNRFFSKKHKLIIIHDLADNQDSVCVYSEVLNLVN